MNFDNIKDRLLKKIKKKIINNKKYPNRIFELRDKLKFSNSQIAAILECTETNVHYIGTGRNTISSDQLIILSNLFGVTIDYILGISDNKGNYMSISDKLIELRGDRTHKQYAAYLNKRLEELLGEKIGKDEGINERTLRGYEYHIITPKLETLSNIAKLENLDVDYFITHKIKDDI
jgi:transcriptional regulator with XRE-family HTH domain